MRIKQLDEATYSKIAAGEVIERPASVIRELVDNSIDAGAGEIVIKIEDAGIKKISVSDNGSGILNEDLKLALEKHATSKINQIADLNLIKSMGFRGEALNSIQVVSKLTLISNTDPSGKSSGYKLSNSDFEITPIASRKGTRVEVSDLFYNLPVRKKFLKSNMTELNAVKKVISEKIFSHLNIAFHFYHNNKLVYSTAGDNNFENAFFKVYKNELPFKIFQHSFDYNEQIKIRLFHSNYDYYFQNRKYQLFFVNQRPIQSGFYYSACDSGMRQFLSTGRYPLLFFYLEIDPGLIDINIHPAKKEIKFKDQNQIFNLIRETVTNAYSQLNKSNLLEAEDYSLLSEDKPGYNYDAAPQAIFDEKTLFPAFKQQKKDYFEELVKEEKYGGEKYTTGMSGENYKILGVLFDTYIVIEKENKLFLLDQHALSEAYLFKVKKEKVFQLNEKEKLIVPIILEINDWNEEIMKKLDFMNKNGFTAEKSEGQSVVIRELPSFLSSNKDYTVILEVIQKYLENDLLIKNEQLIEQFIIETACKEAVKKGDKLTFIEIEELLNVFFQHQLTHCPHGRPVYYSLEKDAIEKMFQRKM